MISAGELGDKEDTRQRRMHDAGHQSCHAHQCKTRFGHHQTGYIHDARGDKSDNSTHEERGCEDTSDSTAAVGGYRRDYLQQNDGDKINQ